MEVHEAYMKIACFVMSLVFVTTPLLCPAAEEKEAIAGQQETIIELNDWDKEVETAMVMYIKGKDGTLTPGYLADNRVFYEFSERNKNVWNGAENRMTDHEKKSRTVTKPDRIIKIKRPVQYWYVLWKDGANYPGCWCKKDDLFFVFLGFGKIDKDKMPAQGPISGVGVFWVDAETEEIFNGPGTGNKLPKTEIVLVNGPAKEEDGTEGK